MTLKNLTLSSVTYSSPRTINCPAPIETAVADNPEFPAIPPEALATLFNAMTQAKDVGHNWTQDEYVGELADRCFRLSPSLRDCLNQQSGLQLTEPQNGQPKTLSSMVAGLHLTSFEANNLWNALETIFWDGLSQPAIPEPYPDGEKNQLAQSEKRFSRMLADHTEPDWEISEALSALFGQEEVVTQGNMPADSLDTVWKKDLAMLQEFRKLGQNHAFLLLDKRPLEASAQQLSRVADRPHNGVIGEAAAALRDICLKLVSNQPAETGDQKKSMREVIEKLTAMSASLLNADAVLSEAREYYASGKNGDTATLPVRLNEAKASLRHAWKELQNTVTWIGQQTDHEWSKRFLSNLRVSYARLEIKSLRTLKALKEAKSQSGKDLQAEKVRMEKEAGTLSLLAEKTSRPVIRVAAEALKNCCDLAGSVMRQQPRDSVLPEIKKTAELLFELSESLQSADITLPAARALLKSGAEPKALNRMADQLETQRKALDNTLTLLNSYAGAMEEALPMGKALSPGEQSLSKLINKIRTQEERFLQVDDALKKVKHDLRPQKSAGEIVMKKAAEGAEFAKIQLSQTFSAIKHTFRLAARTADLGVRHVAHSEKQKGDRPDSVETQRFNGLLSATAYGPLSNIQKLCEQAEKLAAATKKVGKSDGVRDRNKQYGVLVKGENKNAPGTTQAERLVKKLAALNEPRDAVHAALKRVTAEIDQTQKDLTLLERQYPQQFTELNAFRKQLLNAEKTCTEVVKTLDNQVKMLQGESEAAIPPAFAGTFKKMRTSMDAVQDAITAAVKRWEELPEAAQELLSDTEIAVKKVVSTTSQAAELLNHQKPDAESFEAAAAEAVSALEDPALISVELTAVAGFMAIVEDLHRACQLLRDIKREAGSWKKANVAAAPHQPIPLPVENDFRKACKKIMDAVYQAANARGAVESSITHITGSRLEVFSPDARIIKHLAGILAGQTAALNHKFLPEERENYAGAVDGSINDIAQHFRKSGDPTGDKFALRLKKEYLRELEGKVVLPQSTREVLEQSQTWAEYMVQSGAKNLQSRLIYTAASQAVDAALSSALPAISGTAALRAIAKFVITPLPLTIELGKLDKSLMPGDALPRNAKSNMIANSVGIAATRLLSPLLPPMVKMMQEGALTGIQLWRDGSVEVWDKLKERLPEDIAGAIALRPVNEAIKSAFAGKLTPEDMPLIQQPSETKIDVATELKQNQQLYQELKQYLYQYDAVMITKDGHRIEARASADEAGEPILCLDGKPLIYPNGMQNKVADDGIEQSAESGRKENSRKTRGLFGRAHKIVKDYKKTEEKKVMTLAYNNNAKITTQTGQVLTVDKVQDGSEDLIYIADGKRILTKAQALSEYIALANKLKLSTSMNLSAEKTASDIYNRAYPHELNIKKISQQSLTDIFRENNEHTLTPNSIVRIKIQRFDTDGYLDEGYYKTASLYDIARGALVDPSGNGHITVEGLPPTIASIFHTYPYIGRQTFSVTTMLNDKIQDKISEFETNDSSVFRGQVWKGSTKNILTEMSKTKKIPELKMAADSEIKSGHVTFRYSDEKIPMPGIIAIPKTNGNTILVNLLTRETLEVKIDKQYDSDKSAHHEDAKNLKAFLLPNFDLRRSQLFRESDENSSAFHSKLTSLNGNNYYHQPGADLYNYVSPLNVNMVNSLDELGSQLSASEITAIKSNAEFLITTEGEIWAKALIAQGQKFVNGLAMLAAPISGVPAVSAFNIGLTFLSHLLAAGEISLADDSKKDALKKDLLMDIALSLPGHAGDTAEIINRFKKMKKAIPVVFDPFWQKLDNAAPQPAVLKPAISVTPQRVTASTLPDKVLDEHFEIPDSVSPHLGNRYILQVGETGKKKWRAFEGYAKSSITQHNIPRSNIYGELGTNRPNSFLQRPDSTTFSGLTMNDRLDVPVHGSILAPSSSKVKGIQGAETFVYYSPEALAKKLYSYGLRQVGILRLESCNVGSGDYVTAFKKELDKLGIKVGYLAAPNGYLTASNLPYLHIRPIWQLDFKHPWKVIEVDSTVNLPGKKIDARVNTSDIVINFSKLEEAEKISYLTKIGLDLDEAKNLIKHIGSTEVWKIIRATILNSNSLDLPDDITIAIKSSLQDELIKRGMSVTLSQSEEAEKADTEKSTPVAPDSFHLSGGEIILNRFQSLSEISKEFQAKYGNIINFHGKLQQANPAVVVDDIRKRGLPAGTKLKLPPLELSKNSAYITKGYETFNLVALQYATSSGSYDAEIQSKVESRNLPLLRQHRYAKDIVLPVGTRIVLP
ncbi:hypothetical protein [Winslowiella iniecta]|uniref:Tox-PLDMTX domain-containing protein n=1 Tax=Winslowiella iniecta TaxID=1560201 RepID=A0A0L7T6X0_9GAMM|nr:hypothetical protein [Winslowiella iniecta]KOC91100.1 hypothetical protein NG42_06555 [Winslowiella iniecta]